MNEIQIINNLRKIIKTPVAMNIDDDVLFDKKNSLISSIDTYNEKIHYPNFKYPHKVVKKIIRSSISDIISKGVDPKYMLMTFSGTANNFSKKNIKLIINSIKQEQKKFNFSLVGGDITSSIKSSFTVCIFSYSKRIVKRNNCLKDDDIYVTGNIGDSSVGLFIIKKKFKTSPEIKKYFIDKYYKPNLAFGFHRKLLNFANSSMDISDGLLSDLKKMLKNKNQGYIIDFNKLPKSKYFKKLLSQKKIFDMDHLFKGDDYQIIFTANKNNRNHILKFAKMWNQKITRIGNITGVRGNYLKFNNQLKKIKDYQGYIHN